MNERLDPKEAFTHQEQLDYEGQKELRQIIKYPCHVVIMKEDNNEFYAIVSNLPGVVSSGNSTEEVIANVKEALTETIKSYNDSGEKIPWKIPDTNSIAVKNLWILIDI